MAAQVAGESARAELDPACAWSDAECAGECGACGFWCEYRHEGPDGLTRDGLCLFSPMFDLEMAVTGTDAAFGCESWMAPSDVRRVLTKGDDVGEK